MANLTEWHKVHPETDMHPSGVLILKFRTVSITFAYVVYPDGHFVTDLSDTNDDLLAGWIAQHG